MRFPTAALASSLALISFVSAQVVVTVTSTLTVVTITYTPTTSTSTIIVSVTGSAPPHQSTSTKTITVTATSPVSTAATFPCPQIEWGQCGGEGYSGNCAGNCSGDSVCKYKDVWYSYCSDLPKLVHEINTVYLG